jgi:ribosome-associated protein
MGRKRKKSSIEWRDGYEVDHRQDDENPDLSYLDSRTEIRGRRQKEITATRVLVNECTTLEDDIFIGCSLSDSRLSDLKRLKSMKGSGARQRLLKHVTHTLTDHEVEVMTEVLNRVQEAPERAKKREKRLTAWRDRLAQEGEEALLPALTRFPKADLRELRRLTLQSQRNPESASAKGARKALLKLLRELDQL